MANAAARESAECARSAGEAAIASVFGPSGWRPEIEHVVEAGCIEHLVERHSENATLLVIGSRSRRRLRDRLRPSATNRITGRVSCPVVSVPECVTKRSVDSSSSSVGDAGRAD